MGHNCSGWGGDPSGTQQGPQSSSLGLSLEWQAQHGTQGASASETRAGLWIHLLGLGTPGSSLWGHLGRPSGIIVPSPQWTRRAGGGQCQSFLPLFSLSLGGSFFLPWQCRGQSPGCRPGIAPRPHHLSPSCSEASQGQELCLFDTAP